MDTQLLKRRSMDARCELRARLSERRSLFSRYRSLFADRLEIVARHHDLMSRPSRRSRLQINVLAAYCDPDGIIHQCLKCDRVQRATQPTDWYLISESLVTGTRNLVVQRLCPRCMAETADAPAPPPTRDAVSVPRIAANVLCTGVCGDSVWAVGVWAASFPLHDSVSRATT